MGDGKYNRMLKVRYTDTESSRLAEIASEAGLSQSEIIRRWINEKRIVSRVDQKMIAEMRRAGGLLKHLALRLIEERANKKLAEELFSQGVSILQLAKKAQESLE